MIAHPRRTVGVALFALGFLLFTVMTVISYVKDASDPVIRAQLARQTAEEDAFRASPFVPLKTRTSESAIDETGDTQTRGDAGKTEQTANTSSSASNSNKASQMQKAISATFPPESYITKCSGCHGTRGQGVKIYPRLIGVSTKPRRTIEDLIAIMNDPASYGLDPLMPSFKDKLTEDEKREIAEWMAALKKR